ncbi:hypothetical protein HY572_00415 [Candidatus Micrarchaeota archaeon]|nr:hypothetical protein [Candidatus Micrarchaeota archaeon]
MAVKTSARRPPTHHSAAARNTRPTLQAPRMSQPPTRSTTRPSANHSAWRLPSNAVRRARSPQELLNLLRRQGLGNTQAGRTANAANLSNLNASHFLDAARADTDEEFQDAVASLRRQGGRNPHIEAQIALLVHNRRMQQTRK